MIWFKKRKQWEIVQANGLTFLKLLPSGAMFVLDESYLPDYLEPGSKESE